MAWPWPMTMSEHSSVSVGIVGGTGYTGVELLRLLARHPLARLNCITSRGDAGKPVGEVYPSLRGHVELDFSAPDAAALAACDIVFFATPSGIAMDMADALLSGTTRIIDLSADFRLRDAAVWSDWYGAPHTAPQWLPEAVYGLPEFTRAAIADARLVACAGCYPTAVQLGWLPLLASGRLDCSDLVADVKSGVSGAGRKAEIATLMSETGESFKAYSVSGHRHWPEIVQGLKAMGAPDDLGLTFVPHLTPMIRGIHATLYAPMPEGMTLDEVQALYLERYRDEVFVDVLPTGAHPDTRNVRGSNRCQIALHQPRNSRRLVVLSVIDNLVKGASGQAVQVFNRMLGVDEAMGLDGIGLYP